MCLKLELPVGCGQICFDGLFITTSMHILHGWRPNGAFHFSIQNFYCVAKWIKGQLHCSSAILYVLFVTVNLLLQEHTLVRLGIIEVVLFLSRFFKCDGTDKIDCI